MDNAGLLNKFAGFGIVTASMCMPPAITGGVFFTRVCCVCVYICRRVIYPEAAMLSHSVCALCKQSEVFCVVPVFILTLHAWL